MNWRSSGNIASSFLVAAVPGTAAISFSSMSAHLGPRQRPYTEILKNPLADNVVETMEIATFVEFLIHSAYERL